jgi:hypothetical protein
MSDRPVRLVYSIAETLVQLLMKGSGLGSDRQELALYCFSGKASSIKYKSVDKSSARSPKCASICSEQS